MSQENNYLFVSRKIESRINPVIIMGVNRSGKTILGNLIATSLNVEHLDEPWLLFSLPTLIRLKIINSDIGRDMFLTNLAELMNDTILLRRANFRPNDLSSIWLQKTPSEIFSRLIELQSRSDVNKYIKINRPTSLLTLSEAAMSNLPVLVDILPTCKIIFVVRNGLDVANQIYQKKWFHNERLTNPNTAQLYRLVRYKKQKMYIPWWVEPENDKEFIEYSEFERGLYYWCVLMERATESFKKINNKYIQVRYEDLLKDPQAIMERVGKFLSIKLSPMTAMAVKNVNKYNREPEITTKLSRKLLIRAKNIYKLYGYKF